MKREATLAIQRTQFSVASVHPLRSLCFAHGSPFTRHLASSAPSPLCFHNLTKPFFCSSPVFITLQNARGVSPPSLLQFFGRSQEVSHFLGHGCSAIAASTTALSSPRAC